MRWLRYALDGSPHYGRLHGEDDIEQIAGTPWGEHTTTGLRHPLSSVRLLPPVVPGTFYAAGLNYVEHLKHYADVAGARRAPTKPDIGYRAVNALIAHGEPIIIPRDAGPKVQYEGELVVVIGRKVKHLSQQDALSCVFGYTIGNDVSERDWQKSDGTMWRSKNTDTWKPMGPWIETDLDLDAARTTVRVNGEVTVEFATNQMLFGIAEYISAMTRYLTLYPGDMIWMGTEGASPNMKPGDVCEVAISGIGALRNTFTLEA